MKTYRGINGKIYKVSTDNGLFMRKKPNDCKCTPKPKFKNSSLGFMPNDELKINSGGVKTLELEWICPTCGYEIKTFGKVDESYLRQRARKHKIACAKAISAGFGEMIKPWLLRMQGRQYDNNTTNINGVNSNSASNIHMGGQRL